MRYENNELGFEEHNWGQDLGFLKQVSLGFLNCRNN